MKNERVLVWTIAKKMNVLREYNPRLFDILGLPYEASSKKQLSEKLWKYLKENDCFVVVQNDTHIILTPAIQELSGLEQEGTYSITGDGLWVFVTLIYKKWKI